MDRRTNEGHMEFEWQNGGPIDPGSPLGQLSINHRRIQQEMANGNASQKRPYSVFDSPSKLATPALREPASQTFLFNNPSPTKSTSALSPAFRTSAFTTPRKVDYDMSSGPEAASSPDNADAEDTPEMPGRSAMVQFNSRREDASLRNSEAGAGEKHQAFLRSLTNAVTPGRGEISRKGKYSNALVHKVNRRRRNDRERDLRLARGQNGNIYDSDSERPGSSDSTGCPPYKPGIIGGLFSYLESHPHLPHVLSFYAQLLLNVFLVFFVIYIMYSFWSTIRSDVEEASKEVAAETMAEMAACAQQFVDNKCDRRNRVPAMESVCNNWERCMNKDPSAVGRARVSAHTFAQIFNSFIEPISYKAMIFSLALIFGCVAISNFAFGFFRNKAISPTFMHPIATPSHHNFDPYQQQQQYYNTPYKSFEPAPSVGMSMQTPRRRVEYR